MLYFRHLRGQLGCVRGDAKECEYGLHANPLDLKTKARELEWPKPVGKDPSIRKLLEAERLIAAQETLLKEQEWGVVQRKAEAVADDGAGVGVSYGAIS